MQEQYRGLETILKKCLNLLKALARGNDLVQLRMFERLDNLLRIKVVEADLAIALKEVCVTSTSHLCSELNIALIALMLHSALYVIKVAPRT